MPTASTARSLPVNSARARARVSSSPAAIVTGRPRKSAKVAAVDRSSPAKSPAEMVIRLTCRGPGRASGPGRSRLPGRSRRRARRASAALRGVAVRPPEDEGPQDRRPGHHGRGAQACLDHLLEREPGDAGGDSGEHHANAQPALRRAPGHDSAREVTDLPAEVDEEAPARSPGGPRRRRRGPGPAIRGATARGSGGPRRRPGGTPWRPGRDPGRPRGVRS